jgi:hypothetical protein
VPGSTLTAQADDQIAKTRVTVDRSDVGVDLVLTPGARVAGRVIFEGTSRRPDGLEVVAVPPEQGGGPEPPRNNYQPARIRPDGSFRLTRLLGTLELRVVPDTRGWRPKSITAGGRSLLDIAVDFTGGEDLRDVVIVMTDRTAALTGSISSGSQTPLPASLSVLVFPRNSQQAHRARWLRPDQLGRFVVTDLSPGDYPSPPPRVDDLQWQNAAYLNRFRSAALMSRSGTARPGRSPSNGRVTMISRTLTSLALLGVVAAASGQPHRLPATVAASCGGCATGAATQPTGNRRQRRRSWACDRCRRSPAPDPRRHCRNQRGDHGDATGGNVQFSNCRRAPT